MYCTECQNVLKHDGKNDNEGDSGGESVSVNQAEHVGSGGEEPLNKGPPATLVLGTVLADANVVVGEGVVKGIG